MASLGAHRASPVSVLMTLAGHWLAEQHAGLLGVQAPEVFVNE
jgi:hypothetical protein